MNTKRRILIVDDEAGFTRLLRLNLHQSGNYIVREVNHSSEALASACAFAPDLVLMDVMMPDLDGGELAARFLADPKLKNVPIVFLTAAVKKQEIASNGGQIGGLPFLAKPVDLPEVIDCIERHLQN